MCKTGTVFDIKEFAVYDGPGIRDTVFMKGCPLRCRWCHNPEGLSVHPQLMVSTGACAHCGACERVCRHREGCISCGDCVSACHLGLRRIAGRIWKSDDLAQRLMRDLPILSASGGGVTFSGGEPLAQWPFVKEVIRQMPGMHTCMETSGYAGDAVFLDAMENLSMIIMDAKLLDAEEHRRWTGVDNAAILRHAQMLCRGSLPFILRSPIIPGVNDRPEHFEGLARLAADAPHLVSVELLPYHMTAGAKYVMLGQEYRPGFDTQIPVKIDTKPFEEHRIPYRIM